MSAAAVLTGDTTARARVAPRRPRLTLVATGPAVRSVRRARLRLTRAGRLFCTMLVLGVVLASGAAAMASGGSKVDVITVAPGQTLSDIAARELPGVELGAAVTEIQISNGLNGSEVRAGQRLTVPRD